MKKTLSLFILLFFIFSCKSSDNPTLTPNDNNESTNKKIIPGLYQGHLKLIISTTGQQPQERPNTGVSISFLEDGSLYSEIFDKITIPAGTLKHKSGDTYYGEYTNSSTSTTYKIEITVLSDITIYVNIISERTDGDTKDTSTYIGNLSRQ